MRKKYTLSRIGAVALLANFAICGANAQVRATQQSAPSISNTIMRVASEDGRKLWAMYSSTTGGPVSAKTITLTDGMNLWLKIP